MKTRQTEEVGRQHQGMDRPGICHVPEGGAKQRKMGETGCEVNCGAPTAPEFKGGVKCGGVVIHETIVACISQNIYRLVLCSVFVLPTWKQIVVSTNLWRTGISIMALSLSV